MNLRGTLQVPYRYPTDPYRNPICSWTEQTYRCFGYTCPLQKMQTAVNCLHVKLSDFTRRDANSADVCLCSCARARFVAGTHTHRQALSLSSLTHAAIARPSLLTTPSKFVVCLSFVSITFLQLRVHYLPFISYNFVSPLHSVSTFHFPSPQLFCGLT
jgi:hypothetical protein